MVKILIGLLAAIIIATGGYFGFEFYVQHRVAGEVEAAFEQVRAGGGKASHGAVSYDPWSRTVTIADIAVEAAQPPVSVKIARFVASGVNRPDPTRFSADSIEAGDVEVGGTMATQAGWRLTYKAPQIVVKDYSGPTGLQQPASSSAADMYRIALQQFATVTASSVTARSVVGTLDYGATTGDVSYTYSDVALRDIKNGNVATTTVGRLVFAVDMPQAGKTEKLAGDIAGLALYDFDTASAAAIFDPARANDNGYTRVYRQMTAGAYSITSDRGGPRPSSTA